MTAVVTAVVPGVVRAELRRMLRWPAVWVLSGAWLALNLTFGYVFPYLTYRTGEPTGPGAGGAALEPLLPDQAPLVVVQGMPMFGGALVLVLGALVVGSGFGWGTWKSAFTTGPSRVAALGGTFAALGVVLAGLVVATLVADLAASSVLAAIEDRNSGAPGLTATLAGLGAALLVAAMWAGAGALLGALTRAPAMALGMGLVWSLVVENLLRGVASVISPLQTVADLLPGTVAGSLAGALGASASGPDGTPGVNNVWEGGPATVLLIAYLLAFAFATVRLASRRDLSG